MTVLICVDIYKIFTILINIKTKQNDMAKKFDCKRCGRCCIHSIPQFEEAEYLAVRDFALQRGILFKELNTKDGLIYTPLKTYERLMGIIKGCGQYVGKEPVLWCEFLIFDENHKASCMIYGQRPIVCRAFGLNSEDITKRCLNL